MVTQDKFIHVQKTHAVPVPPLGGKWWSEDDGHRAGEGAERGRFWGGQARKGRQGGKEVWVLGLRTGWGKVIFRLGCSVLTLGRLCFFQMSEGLACRV